jgi:hypothetical protein
MQKEKKKKFAKPEQEKHKGSAPSRTLPRHHPRCCHPYLQAPNYSLDGRRAHASQRARQARTLTSTSPGYWLKSLMHAPRSTDMASISSTCRA